MKNWIDAEHPTVEDAAVRVSNAVDRLLVRLGQLHGGIGRVYAALGVQSNIDADEQEKQLDRAKEIFANELSKILPSMLNAGIKKTKGMQFPPTIGQFVDACKPTAESAFFEAQAGISERSRGKFGVWSCPAVFHAALAFGTSELKQAQYNLTKHRWQAKFDAAMEAQERGDFEAIPAPEPEPSRIEYTPRSEPSPEVAKKVEEIQNRRAPPATNWANNPKSMRAAELLVDGLNVLQHRGALEFWGKHHVQLGNLKKNEKGLFVVARFPFKGVAA